MRPSPAGWCQVVNGVLEVRGLAPDPANLRSFFSHSSHCVVCCHFFQPWLGTRLKSLLIQLQWAEAARLKLLLED